MTLNDPELMVREWLEKIYALAGPGADMLVHLIEQGVINECYEDFNQIGRDLTQLDDIRTLAEQAEVASFNDSESVDLVPILRMFLPV